MKTSELQKDNFVRFSFRTVVLFFSILFLLGNSVAWYVEFLHEYEEAVYTIEFSKNRLQHSMCSPSQMEALNTYDLCSEARYLSQRNASTEALYRMASRWKICNEDGTGCFLEGTIFENWAFFLLCVILVSFVFLLWLSPKLLQSRFSYQSPSVFFDPTKLNTAHHKPLYSSAHNVDETISMNPDLLRRRSNNYHITHEFKKE